ncbi:hypothetical protein C3L33_00160, partial [Rhododendron williamsianum]
MEKREIDDEEDRRRGASKVEANLKWIDGKGDWRSGAAFWRPNHCLAWPDGKWSVIVGSKLNREGKAILYRSVETSMIGHGIKYVLKASLDDTKHEFYTIGMYDHDKDIYIPDEGSVEGDLGLRYDYGKFYASKTFFDSKKNRRVLWGWINESTNATIDIMKGWSGVQV